MATQYTIDYYVNGEALEADILNRPIEDVEMNLDELFTLVNSADPFPQYTTDAEATVIAEDNAIVFAIALG